jgi:hypothetical protein
MKPSELDAACSPPNGVPGATFGSGWECDRWWKKKRALHSGRLPGSVGVLAVFPEDSVAVAILSNTGGGVPIAGLLSRVSGYVLGLVPTRVEDPPLPDSLLLAFAGTYGRPGGNELVIHDQGRLTLVPASGSSFRLIPIGPREFGAAFDLLVRVRFDAPIAGLSPGITITQGARTTHARRVPDS